MSEFINIKRRRFLHYAGAGMVAAALFPKSLLAESNRRARYPSPSFHPDVEIELIARTAHMPILPGTLTHVWKYDGRLLKGPKGSVEALPKSYLGPLIRAQKGQKVRIYFKNDLPASSITHWHGLHVPADMDGNPLYAIEGGQTYTYEFEINNRAGTYWFHPHPHGETARQVYAGLAGLFLVSDEEEKALDLPRGEYDVPLVLQDRTFDDDNQLRYATHRMQLMMGFQGERILVNGQPDFMLPVATRAYRLRFLNGSNSRIYKLAWEDGTPLTVIGTDGGLLEHPERRPYVMLAPGERVEVWMDFSGRKIGSELTLRSLAFSAASMHGRMMGGGGHGMMHGHGMGGGRHGMMQGMMGSAALPVGSDYPVLKVHMARKASDNSVLPARLSSLERYSIKHAVNADQPRPIALSMRHMSPLLNGRSYEMDSVMEIEKIPLNSLQLIEIYHEHRGMMMSMPHPIHLHGQQFQVISRTVDSARSQYDTVREGFVDGGWKDTVLVMPGESVKIIKPFEDYKGRFMYHCHNLEHEDLGMMRDFLVV